MAAHGFLVAEIIVSLLVFTISVLSYAVLLLLSVVIRCSATLKILALLQRACVNFVPILLLFWKSPGLAEESGLRLLEEIALQSLRYKAVVRPAIAYVGI